MRSVSLFVVAALAVLMVLSSTPNAFAAGQIGWGKRCVADDSADVVFHFAVTDPSGKWQWQMGCDEGYAMVGAASGTYVFTELVSESPDGWSLAEVTCERISGSGQTSWKVDGATVTVNYDRNDVIACYFTNTRATGAVGGLVEPVNTLAVFASWLGVIGLVGCIGTVAVVVKRR